MAGDLGLDKPFFLLLRSFLSLHDDDEDDEDSDDVPADSAPFSLKSILIIKIIVIVIIVNDFSLLEAAKNKRSSMKPTITRNMRKRLGRMSPLRGMMMVLKTKAMILMVIKAGPSSTAPVMRIMTKAMI